MKTGLITPQGTDSFKADTWQKVYEDTLASAQTSITISDLDGNTDVMYRLVVRQILGASNTGINLRINNDSTADIYGFQRLMAHNTTISASRNTESGMNLYYTGTGSVGNIHFLDVNLYAKSGYVRTLLTSTIEQVSGTTVDGIILKPYSWNNIVDNVVSLVIYSNTNGLGIGTYLKLEKLNL